MEAHRRFVTTDPQGPLRPEFGRAEAGWRPVRAFAKEDGGGGKTYLHQGIAARAFERRFNLADHIQVSGAALEKGLLYIDLVRKVPEALKARRIAIGTGEHKHLDQKAA